MKNEIFSQIDNEIEISELDAPTEKLIQGLTAEIAIEEKSSKNETIFSAKGAALTLKRLMLTAYAKYGSDTRVNFDHSNFEVLASDAYIILFERWIKKGRTAIPAISYLTGLIDQAAKSRNLVVSDWGMLPASKLVGPTGCSCGCDGDWADVIWQIRTMTGGGKYKWEARVDGQPVAKGAWQRALCPSCLHQLQTTDLSHADDLECAKISLEVQGEDGEVSFTHENIVLHPEYDSYAHHKEADDKKVASDKADKAAKRDRFIRMGGDVIQKYCDVVFEGGTAKDAAKELGISEQALSLKVIFWRSQCAALETGKKLPASDTVLERNTAKLQGGLFDALFFQAEPTEAKKPVTKRATRPTGPNAPTQPQASF